MKFKLVESIEETDSEGNVLSPEQIEFFKNSKVRDRSGKLLVCYHGTNSDEFHAFDRARVGDGSFGIGFYFTKYADEATEYGSRVIETYLNITNPFYLGHEGQTEQLIDYLRSNGVECPEDIYEWGNIFEYFDFKPFVTDAVKALGYDGMIPFDDMYIAFEPNQIKSITNKNPSSSDNMNEDALRKDLSDDPYEFNNEVDYFGNKLSKEQADYFKDSMVRITGKLLPVYHGAKNPFRSFERGYSDRHSKDEQGFYWAAFDKEYADEYSNGGDIYTGYLNIENILDIGNIDSYTDYDRAIRELADATGIPVEEIESQMEKYRLIYELTGSKWFMDKIASMGYDGVLAWESGLKTFGFMNSSQFKLMDNRNPTGSNNIDEGLSPASIDEQTFKDAFSEPMNTLYGSKDMGMDVVCERLYYDYGIDATYHGATIYVGDKKLCTLRFSHEGRNLWGIYEIRTYIDGLKKVYTVHDFFE